MVRADREQEESMSASNRIKPSELSLRKALHVTYGAASRKEVTAWFSNPAPLRVDPEVFAPLLSQWQSSVDPQTRNDRQPVIEALQRAATTGIDLTYNL
jgi:hypothetical protein